MGRLMVLLLALAGALQGQPSSAAGDRMLVFTKTAGYRHDSIPAAVAAIRDLASRHGLAVDHTEDAGVFRPDTLARYKAVGFVNTTGNVLDREQQRAVEAFVEAGGGYLGIHSAADTGYDWPCYGQLLGGQFKSHPAGLQTGVVRFARPLGAPAPIAWQLTDEFYDFASRPSGEATVIARLATRAAKTSMILDIDSVLFTVGVPCRSVAAAPIPPRVDRDRMERSPTLRSFGFEFTAQQQSKDPG